MFTRWFFVRHWCRMTRDRVLFAMGRALYNLGYALADAVVKGGRERGV